MGRDNVKEIERAIGALTPREVAELCLWIEQNYSHTFDVRVESDLADGRLDSAIQRALDDEKSGRVRPL